MQKYKKELQVAKAIAKKAEKIMLRYFRGDNQAEIKSDGSPVTIADKSINSMVIKELQKHFKDVIIGEEESTGEYGMGRRWFCDPIDGTRAYVWGAPTSMFSLALVVDGVPVLGVAHDPYLKKTYYAMKGGGAWCNKKKLHVSSTKMDKGYIATTSIIENILKKPDWANYLVDRGARLAVFSGAVYKMCLVGSGYLAGYIETELNGHDCAAAQLIVEEAGGKVSGLDGKALDYSKPFKGAVFSNGVVHQNILDAVSKC